MVLIAIRAINSNGDLVVIPDTDWCQDSFGILNGNAKHLLEFDKGIPELIGYNCGI